MGNKLSTCSCGPLIRKAYRYEDSPWQNCKRRDGHLLRLWAEVFHVSASGTGSVKWAQVSEDLVPVNITCIQDHPECVFHITAYNSQVDKILDVRLVQPGTRIGQASECFVYWKDPLTNDTWGLNFTSPIDAKQFRECCSPSFKFSRKASSSYSLKLEPPNKQSKIKTRRKPLSTPASPSRSREPQCTCMTADQYARLKAQDPRFRGSSTLPRTQSKAENGTDGSGSNTLPNRDKVTTGTSSASLYDTVGSDKSKSTGSIKQMKDRETATPGGKISSHITANAQTPHATISTSTSTPGIASQTDDTEGTCKSEGVQAGIHKTSTGTCTPRLSVSGKDYMDDPSIIVNHISPNIGHGRTLRSNNMNKYMRDDLRSRAGNGMNVDSNTLKRMLKPMPSLESPVTSPEMSRRRYHYYPLNAPQNPNLGYYHHMNDSARDGALSEPETHSRHRPSRISGSRSTHDISRDRDYASNRLYLDLDRDGRSLGEFEDASPPSDNDLFDNQCYATTPSSSNGRMNAENPTVSTPSSPTSRLLLEYEMHLRNTLARGMDAESYSLHTFEALLTQSMENLEFAEKLPQLNARSPHTSRRRPMGNNSGNKTATLPHRLSLDRANSTSRDREGYYSDRNELARERERGYLSDREQRERGYLSDHNISSNRCNSCLGGSSRSQWFRHSDGWRSGTSTMSSMSSGGGGGGYGLGSSFQSDVPLNTKRSAWESLPSLRHENSVTDAGFKLGRSDSLERRALRDRHDPYRYDRDGILSHQTSVESTDSKLCYLTSSEMSDDDRMSLTTAISDDDDIDESLQNSPYSRARKANSASFNCTGAVRKAGFLSVKKWLLRKKKQIELARKRGWKGYWVCLKGTTLLFYPCDSRERHSPDAAPKHLIIVDGAIMQPIPEHPKRDYIFCLSTAFGDAYLFQAPCQVELENWINSIHSACAAAFARHRGKTGTFHLLSEEVFKVEKALESDHKMKHMAELQLSVVSDPDMKQQLSNQIMQYDENMERLYCEQFRLRCYISSLQNGELPNPKNLLTHVSRPTKHALNKLGVFTVSSFHAYICSRSPSLLNNLLAGRGSTKRRAPMLSRSNSASSRRSLSMSSRDDERTVKVSLPDNQTTQIYLKDAMTVEEYIASACLRKNLNPMQHFVRVKKRRDMEDHNYFVPHRSDLIETYLNTHEIVEICVKVLYQVELVRTSVDHMWGFSVEAELIENTDRQDELCVWVSRVEDKGTAVLNGIIKGDEIMVINSSIVSDLDMMYIESVLQEELCLCMMMRSSRIEPPSVATTASMLHNTDDIESLVCPPPPTDPPVISEEMISGLIVPAPCYTKDQQTEMLDSHPPRHSKKLPVARESANISSQTNTATHTHDTAKQPSRASSLEIENLVKSAGEVTGFCRSPVETERSSPTGSLLSSQSQLHTATTPNKVLTDAEKLRKVILELIETERTYVRHLNNLLENYLEPLKKETFLTTAEISVLFGNILEIINFQHQFLENLNEALAAEVRFHDFDHPSQFKNILFSIGSAFLYYVDHFKLYSSFCASHSKAQKILNPNEGNYALQEFLAARNPRQQHSSTLESYLIKPIQRILKYPLLLQQLRNLTDPNTDEHLHLVEALKGMEKVAEHINEMQRIHEEYGAIFDHLFRQHQKPIDLSPGDLLYYGGVEWINISDFIGKIKKGLELHAMCFVFKSAVVFLCKERIRQKKKLMSVSVNKGGDVEIIRYQVLIPVTDVQVRTIAKEGEDHFLWELVHMRCHPQRRSERVYLLSNSTNDFRNAFIKTIRQTIRESVRNMNIPANKTLPLPKLPINVMSPRTPVLVPTAQKSAEKMLPSENPATKVSDGGCQTMPHPTVKPKKIPPKPPQRRSSTITTEHSESHVEKQHRTKSDYDPGTKSEGEDDSQCSTIKEKSKTLGRTPNHLTLSTASTLSTGSTGSQARLIQSSQHPENYQPPIVKDLGSPVWKPRDMGESLTLPRKNKTPSTSVESRTLVRKSNSRKDHQKL